MSAASISIKVGIASVVLPVIGFVIGLCLQSLIPGCHCDEGSGCSGCGPLGGLIALLILGGFVGALAALIFALPASLAIAAVLHHFAEHGNPLDFIEIRPLLFGMAGRLFLLALVVFAVIMVAAIF